MAKKGRATRGKPSPRSTKSIHVRDRILNCEPSRNKEQDWRLADAVGAGELAAAPKLPPSVDLRESWWTIGDQGTSGACVGWATADAVLRWHFAKAGKIGQDELLSPRFIWMAAKETDEFSTRPTTFLEIDGTSLKAALDIARKYGCVRDALLPFVPGSLYQGPENTFYAQAAQLKIASYFNLDRSAASWRTWIATNGPILVRLDVDSTWDTAAENKGKLDLYHPETARGGHAAALVGYTADRFIVRNSWGTTWGDGGFGYASFAYAEAAFTESYGMTL
jgi:hypothetical protein